MGIDSYYPDSQIFSSVISDILVQSRKFLAILKCKILPLLCKMLWHSYYSNPNHTILPIWYACSPPNLRLPVTFIYMLNRTTLKTLNGRTLPVASFQFYSSSFNTIHCHFPLVILYITYSTSFLIWHYTESFYEVQIKSPSFPLSINCLFCQKTIQLPQQNLPLLHQSYIFCYFYAFAYPML